MQKKEILRCKWDEKRNPLDKDWAMPCVINIENATRKPLRPLMTSCESRSATVYEDKAKKMIKEMVEKVGKEDCCEDEKKKKGKYIPRGIRNQEKAV